MDCILIQRQGKTHIVQGVLWGGYEFSRQMDRDQKLRLGSLKKGLRLKEIKL